jgi:outer membrane protein assembly factor BamA
MIIPRARRPLKINRLRQLSCVASSVFLLALFLMAGQVVLGQQAGGKALRLAKIEVTGLERYTQEQVTAESGLQIGQAIDIPAADEAANRLMNSGLFKKLSYRFRSTGDQVTITFQIEETKETIPVVFDNFVWFTDQELTDAIRREIPTYDGTASESGAMADKIKAALQNFLNARSIQGHVEYLSSAGESSFLFSVKGAKIPICTLHFPGAVDVKESLLIDASQPLLRQEFSRLDVKAFARATLMPLYRQRGHLRASFLDPEVKLQASDECKGVDVTLQVDEGSIYTWDRAEWSGNTALSAQELTSALGMKTGERADGQKIDKAVGALLVAYTTKGYMTPNISAKPEFDDANRRVIYHYDIKEGPQYHMGTLALRGFSEDEANRLKELWSMKQGDVFDASYPKSFLDKSLRAIMSPSPKTKKVEIEIKPDKQSLLVDVIVRVSEAAAATP